MPDARLSVIVLGLLVGGASAARTDSYTDATMALFLELDGVGDRACAGSPDALARLFITSHKGGLAASHAFANLAFLVGPDAPCTAAGFRHDRDKWLDYIEKSTSLGNPVMQAYYGSMLAKGFNGVTPDPDRAEAMLLTAAQNGSSYAATQLVAYYHDGVFGEPDIALARDWLSIAQGMKPVAEDRAILADFARLIGQ